MLLLRARVDLGAIAIKGYSAFSKAPGLLVLTIGLFSVIFKTLVGESYSSAEKQSVYSTAQGDRPSNQSGITKKIFQS